MPDDLEADLRFAVRLTELHPVALGQGHGHAAVIEPGKKAGHDPSAQPVEQGRRHLPQGQGGAGVGFGEDRSSLFKIKAACLPEDARHGQDGPQRMEQDGAGKQTGGEGLGRAGKGGFQGRFVLVKKVGDRQVQGLLPRWAEAEGVAAGAREKG